MLSSLITPPDFPACFLAQAAVTNGSEGEVPPGFLYKVTLSDTLHHLVTKHRLHIEQTFVLLQVKAVHEYAATDGDELELTIGDVVLVVAFDNPDEQVSFLHLQCSVFVSFRFQSLAVI